MCYTVEEISTELNILEAEITIARNGLNTIKKSMESKTIYSCLLKTPLTKYQQSTTKY